jgi:glutamyl-tRNA reductase
LLIDIAAPRDIHPDVGRLYNVFLYTIDDLAQVTRLNVDMRGNEIHAAMTIMNAEAQKYYEWYNYLRVQPVIVSLRKRFNLLRDRKLAQNAGQIANLPAPAREFFHEFVNSLTDEFLEGPSKTLRELSNTEDWIQFSDSLAKIFNLEP